MKICDLLFTFHRDQPSELPERAIGSSGIGACWSTTAAARAARRSCRSSTSPAAAAACGVTVNPEVKLRALIEITQNLGKALAVDEVLPKMLDSLFKIFLQADRGFVVLRRARRRPLVPKAVKHRRADDEETIRISRTIVNQVMTTQAGDPLGRRRQRRALRHEPEHRRFPHSLDDVRPADRQRRAARWA